jgi:hypothetical protein
VTQAAGDHMENLVCDFDTDGSQEVGNRSKKLYMRSLIINLFKKTNSQVCDVTLFDKMQEKVLKIVWDGKYST